VKRSAKKSRKGTSFQRGRNLFIQSSRKLTAKGKKIEEESKDDVKRETHPHGGEKGSGNRRKKEEKQCTPSRKMPVLGPPVQVSTEKETKERKKLQIKSEKEAYMGKSTVSKRIIQENG